MARDHGVLFISTAKTQLAVCIACQELIGHKEHHLMWEGWYDQDHCDSTRTIRFDDFWRAGLDLDRRLAKWGY